MAVSHRKLSGWYLQIAQNLDAGLPLPEALSLAKGPPKSDVAHMVGKLQAGLSIDSVLQEAPRWLFKADRYLLSAASNSGRISNALRKLSVKHKQSAENLYKVIVATLYPLAVLHFGIFLFPVFNLVEFDADAGMQFHFDAYARNVLVFLLPVWAFMAVLIILTKTNNPVIPRLMLILPGLRGYRKNQALADFAFSLESFINAGTPMVETWFAAGLVSGDPATEKSALSMTEKIKAGQAPGKYISDYSVFPSDFAALYTTGEQTGQLDANLALLNRQYQGNATKSLAQASFWYPKLIFLVLAFYAGYKIIAFYSQYLGGIMKMLE